MCKNKGPTCKVHLYFFIELNPEHNWDLCFGGGVGWDFSTSEE